MLHNQSYRKEGDRRVTARFVRSVEGSARGEATSEQTPRVGWGRTSRKQTTKRSATERNTTQHTKNANLLEIEPRGVVARRTREEVWPVVERDGKIKWARGKGKVSKTKRTWQNTAQDATTHHITSYEHNETRHTPIQAHPL